MIPCLTGVCFPGKRKWIIITASLLGLVPLFLSSFATGHMLLKYSPNATCLTHLAGAGFAFWDTLRQLLLDLLWMKTQEGEVTHFTSPVHHGFSLKIWMKALAYGYAIPSCGLLQSAVCGYIRLELGGGYYLNSLGCMSCHVLSIVSS